MNATMLSEELITLREAAKRLPNHPHVSTVLRWMTRGVRNVRLEAVRVGGVWFTSVEAISRFITATTAAAQGMAHTTAAPEPMARGPVPNDRNLDRELDARGL